MNQLTAQLRSCSSHLNPLRIHRQLLLPHHHHHTIPLSQHHASRQLKFPLYQPHYLCSFPARSSQLLTLLPRRIDLNLFSSSPQTEETENNKTKAENKTKEEGKNQQNHNKQEQERAEKVKKKGKVKVILKLLLTLTSGLLLSIFVYIEYQSANNVNTGTYETSYVEGLLDTYYSRTVKEKIIDRPPLNNEIESDVCIIGGGLAGVSTAISLAEKGIKNIIILENKKIGWGASGLNGGFAISGFQIEEEIIDLVGPEKARKMHQLSIEAQNLLLDRITQHQIQCDVQKVGSLTVSYLTSDEKETKKEIEHINSLLGSNFQFWPKEKVQSIYKTPHYQSAIFDPSSFTLHPLNLILGLARVAEEKGVRIYENSHATALQKDISSDKWLISCSETGGKVKAKDVVLAGASHLERNIDPVVSGAVVPVYTYIAVTEPIGEEKLREVIGGEAAVCDDRFALNYFRPLPGGRLLWGGLAQTYPIATNELPRIMLNDLLKVFPNLEGVRIETTWGGAIAFGAELMPLLGKRDQGLWYATGFGGHGIVPTTLAGELISSAIVRHHHHGSRDGDGDGDGDGDEDLRLFQESFPPRWVGGKLGRLFAQFNYWSYIFLDHYSILVQKWFK